MQGDCGSGIVIKKEDGTVVLVGIYCGRSLIPGGCNGSHVEECATSASDFKKWITETVDKEEDKPDQFGGKASTKTVEGMLWLCILIFVVEEAPHNF